METHSRTSSPPISPHYRDSKVSDDLLAAGPRVALGVGVIGTCAIPVVECDEYPRGNRFGGSASPGLWTGLMEGTLGMRHAGVWGRSSSGATSVNVGTQDMLDVLSSGDA